MQSKNKTQKQPPLQTRLQHPPVPVPAPGTAIRLAHVNEFAEIAKRMVNGVLTFEENADYVQAVLEHPAPAPPPEPIAPEPCESGPGETDRERDALMRKLAAIPDPRTFQTVAYMFEKAMDHNARGGRSITDAAQAASAATTIQFCSRAHNAAFLRTPIGAERGCGMGTQCVMKLNAKIGRCFREFLTPSQQEFFTSKGRREDAETHPCLPCCRSILLTERLYATYSSSKMAMSAAVNPPPFCNSFNIQGEYVIEDSMPITDAYPVPIVMNKWHAYTVVEEADRKIVWLVESGYDSIGPSF